MAHPIILSRNCQKAKVCQFGRFRIAQNDDFRLDPNQCCDNFRTRSYHRNAEWMSFEFGPYSLSKGLLDHNGIVTLVHGNVPRWRIIVFVSTYTQYRDLISRESNVESYQVVSNEWCQQDVKIPSVSIVNHLWDMLDFLFFGTTQYGSKSLSLLLTRIHHYFCRQPHVVPRIEVACIGPIINT